MASALLLAPACLACLAPSVSLSYDFPEGQKLHYRWKIVATTSLESPSQQARDRLETVIDVVQEVVGHSEQNAQLRLTIQPRELIENDVRVDPPPATTLDLELTPAGAVARVVRSAELSQAALVELELDGILREVMPPLPGNPVEIGDGWAATLALDTGRTKVDLQGSARLSGFQLRDRHRLARIRVQRKGTISTSHRVGRADLFLPGTTETDLTADIDLDGGFLVASRARSESHFDIAAGGGRPAGLFDLVIETRAELNDGPQA